MAKYASDRHIAIYYRVGSNRRATQGQKKDLKAWVSEHPLGKEVAWYEDRFTSVTTKRPAWGRLWRDIFDFRVSKLVVWQIDRLGLNGQGLYDRFRFMQWREVGFVSIQDKVDLSSDEGRELVDLMESVFKHSLPIFEQECLDESGGDEQWINATMESIQKHRRGSRPSKVTDEMARRMCQMHLEGHSQIAIAAEVGVSTVTVAKYLRGGLPRNPKIARCRL